MYLPFSSLLTGANLFHFLILLFSCQWLLSLTEEATTIFDNLPLGN
ncbi:hypothetical protein ACMBCN_01170 [Candidatus Liberibacter asiaticus]